MKSKLWLLSGLPIVIFVLSLLVGANGLGCSEYTEYRSSACIQLEEFLGTDLYWPSTIVGLIAFPISLIATPVFLVYAFKAFFGNHAKA
jgi:hypothetical protein